MAVVAVALMPDRAEPGEMGWPLGSLGPLEQLGYVPPLLLVVLEAWAAACLAEWPWVGQAVAPELLREELEYQEVEGQ